MVNCFTSRQELLGGCGAAEKEGGERERGLGECLYVRCHCDDKRPSMNRHAGKCQSPQLISLESWDHPVDACERKCRRSSPLVRRGGSAACPPTEQDFQEKAPHTEPHIEIPGTRYLCHTTWRRGPRQELSRSCTQCARGGGGWDNGSVGYAEG